MPADERIKIIFRRVFVKDDADTFGSGEFFFDATVNGVAVGNRQVFNAVENKSIILPEAAWSHILDVQNLDSFLVRFHGKDEDVFVDDDLGFIQHLLKRPYKQKLHRHSTPFYILDWEVQLAVDGAFGVHPPGDVFATRQNVGSVTCTTVSGTSFKARMEFHPVLPVPASGLPVRPAFPAGVLEEPLVPKPGLTPAELVGAPINAIANPAVIPILGPPEAAPVGPFTPQQLDEANFANERNVARIEFTMYKPKELDFKDDDKRLEWRVVPLPDPDLGGTSNGAVQFFSKPQGRKVKVFGTAAGQVLFEVRFKGALFATYRALVRPLALLPCRCNILNGTTLDSTPRVTPADCKNHVDLANRFMRQLGLQLTLDTNPTRTGGATATGIPGIFRISVSRGSTRLLANTDTATIRNHRPGVMNFAYIHSDFNGFNAAGNPIINLGAATDFPNSAAPVGVGAAPPTAGRAVVTDTGSPSSSWGRPTGVGIGADAVAGPTAMAVIAARQRAGHPQLFAMYLTDSNGGPAGTDHTTAARQLVFANTMAHEFGHILNLGHRVEGTNNTHPTPGIDAPPGTPVAQMSANGIFWDGLNHPPHENVMQWIDPPATAQDFDIVQARAVRQSPLVTGAPTLPPAVVGPAPPKGGGGGFQEYVVVYGDWLDKIAKAHGLPSWKELWDFDGGTGIPNKSRLKSGDPDLIYPGEVIVVPA